MPSSAPHVLFGIENHLRNKVEGEFEKDQESFGKRDRQGGHIVLVYGAEYSVKIGLDCQSLKYEVFQEVEGEITGESYQEIVASGTLHHSVDNSVEMFTNQIVQTLNFL